MSPGSIQKARNREATKYDVATKIRTMLDEARATHGSEA